MDYYILSQDKRIINFVEPAGIINAIGINAIESLDSLHEDEPLVLKIKEKNDGVYLDFIERPYSLASNNLKEVLIGYQENIVFKPVVLTDSKRMQQELYWLTVPARIDCVSSKTVINKDKTLKHLVINELKATYTNIFTIEGILEDIVIVNKDVAESILRRDFIGIRLKKVDSVKEEFEDIE